MESLLWCFTSIVQQFFWISQFQGELNIGFFSHLAELGTVTWFFCVHAWAIHELLGCSLNSLFLVAWYTLNIFCCVSPSPQNPSLPVLRFVFWHCLKKYLITANNSCGHQRCMSTLWSWWINKGGLDFCFAVWIYRPFPYLHRVSISRIAEIASIPVLQLK